jgi:hypothetical protein
MELVKFEVRPTQRALLLEFLQTSCFLFALVVPAPPEDLVGNRE